MNPVLNVEQERPMNGLFLLGRKPSKIPRLKPIRHNNMTKNNKPNNKTTPTTKATNTKDNFSPKNKTKTPTKIPNPSTRNKNVSKQSSISKKIVDSTVAATLDCFHPQQQKNKVSPETTLNKTVVEPLSSSLSFIIPKDNQQQLESINNKTPFIFVEKVEEKDNFFIERKEKEEQVLKDNNNLTITVRQLSPTTSNNNNYSPITPPFLEYLHNTSPIKKQEEQSPDIFREIYNEEPPLLIDTNIEEFLSNNIPFKEENRYPQRDHFDLPSINMSTTLDTSINSDFSVNNQKHQELIVNNEGVLTTSSSPHDESSTIDRHHDVVENKKNNQLSPKEETLNIIEEEEVKITTETTTSSHSSLIPMSFTNNNHKSHKSQKLTIYDDTLYSTIFELAKDGKEIELFKTLIDVNTIENNDNITDEMYGELYKKFLSKGLFAKIIVKKEIETLNAIDPNTGNTALHAAIISNHISTASLISKCKRDATQDHMIPAFLNIDQQNENKETPLHIATLKNFTNVAHLLLQNGSKGFEIKDNQGRTALDIAAIYRREAIAHSISEYGGDVCVMYDESIQRVSATDEEKKEKTYDRFGFTVSDKSKWIVNGVREYVSVDAEKQPHLFHSLYKRRLKEEARIPKWRKMITKMKNRQLSAEHYVHHKVKERVRKGIPNAVRGEAWVVITESYKLKQKNQGMYSQLKRLPLSPKDAKQIDVDIKREFREHKLYEDRYSPHQLKLFNLLRSYCNYNQRLGYTQGMSSIAAMLLMYLEEEDAFWLFVTIMDDHRFNMQEMYINGLPGVKKATYVFEHILTKRLKKFMNNFANNDLGIGLSSFCTRWYMLNMLTQLPFDIAVLIWDLFLSEGNKVIHSVSMAFMRLFKRDLISLKPEEAAMMMSKLNNLDFDLERLMKKIYKSKVKEKVIRKLELEYEPASGR
ncbi:hypothetical protein ABK040_007239 [Willaertia magna]